MISEKELLNKLAIEAGQAIIETDELSKINALCEFFDKLKSKNLFTAIDKHFANQEIKDTAAINNLEKNLIHKLKYIQRQIELYCKERSISLPKGFMCSKDINEFRTYEKGELKSSSGLTNSLIQAIISELSFLMRSKITDGEIWILINKITITNFTRCKVHKKTYCSFDRNLCDCTWQLNNHSPEGLRIIFNELYNFINQNKILHPVLINEFNCFHSQLHQYPALMSIITVLKQTNFNSSHHLEFVEQFANLNESGNITHLIMAPDIIEWELQRQQFERIRKTKIWYKWKKLEEACEVYQNFEHLRKKALEEGDLFLELHLCDIFKKITNPNNHYIRELQQDLKNLCLYIQAQYTPSNAMETAKTNNITNIKNNFNLITAKIDTKSNDLVYSRDNHKDIRFKQKTKYGEESRRKKLILELIKNQPTGISEQQAIDILKTKDNVIDTRRGINDQFKPWGINDYVERANSGWLTIKPTQLETLNQ
jgi:hypothetical protein